MVKPAIVCFRQNRAHNQNSLSRNARDWCQSIPQKPLLSPPLLCQYLPICHGRAVADIPWGCHANFTNAWKPSAQTWWKLTNSQERFCFFSLFPSMAESYLWTNTHIHTCFLSLSHTHTYVFFTMVQPSHFSLEGNQKLPSASLSRTNKRNTIFKML